MDKKADRKMKPTDVVIVGFGWTGAILAKELTEAGLRVVALERGESRDTYPDGAYPKTIDELTYIQRGKLFQDMSKSSFTFRHSTKDTALPYRQIGAFKPGTGVGGAGLHWSGQHWRVHPEELKMASHYREKYGAKFIPEGMQLQDYGVSYDELEPHFTFSEQMMGTSGQAYRVNGKIVGNGNPFEANRSADFPTPAQKVPYTAHIFEQAARAAGFQPFREPSANASVPYTNQYGCTMGPCNFCGFCSGFACFNYSKASPQVSIMPALVRSPLFELRANSNVLKINLDHTGRKATGVTYVDAQGVLIEQPADIVIAATFAYNNAHLFLLSGIGKPFDPQTGEGVVGRNVSYQTVSTVQVYFDKQTETNNFIGSGGNAMACDEYNADNFDHAGLGFVGGSPIWCNPAGVKPIANVPLPPGTPKWGARWKQAVVDSYNHYVEIICHGSNMVYRANYLDLDPTYRDAFGQPLLRFTFNWQDNDIRMSQYVTKQAERIAREMNPRAMHSDVMEFGQAFDLRPYQTTHWSGGVPMGTDPRTSALNRYCQSWDVPNVFAAGSGVFANGIGYNPTGLVCALAYWTARAIREQYLKNPGHLMTA
ncbi:GMC family oxidoreductase [Paraburkholderia tropica]|uniref:GMC family oxidoreductase n=1 Tax=Paraburkholderia tropica TaxID=92647 RepID=UPI001CC557E4|nr:GMC family oxidoreductase [Paraburkholderia tropica]